MLRRKARRAQGDQHGDPLDADQERRVRAVLALGGVPQADLPDGVQQVRLRLLERAAGGQEAPRDVSAWGGGGGAPPARGRAPPPPPPAHPPPHRPPP
ncbi:hypothetical protein ACFV23_42095, partial [Streptomyces sp. NPDC059627]